MPREMSDAEVFGQREMSDAEVFGKKPSVTKDVAKGGAGGFLRTVASTADNAMAGVLGDNMLFQATGRIIGNMATEHFPGRNYNPQTTQGKIAEKVGEFFPNALMGPAGAGRGLAAQVGVRAANVLAPAVGAVAGREGAKAAGFGETGQAVGEFAGSLAGGVGASARMPKLPARVPKAPTLDELRTQKNAAYAAVDQAGITYTPASTKALAADARSRLGDDFDPDLHHGVKSALKKIDALGSGPVTLGKLDLARQYVRDNVLTPTASKGERRLGYKLIEAIDEHIAKTGPGNVQGGTNPQKAAADILRARDLNTRISKGEALEEAAAKAKSKAKQTGGGGNINNATRQQVSRVADRRRDWTPDERAALTNLVEGGKTDNTLRQVGKLSPSGNGLSLWMNLGAAAKTGGLSLPVTAAGAVAKGIADHATQAKVGKLVQLVARGGTNAQSAKAQLRQLAAANPKVPLLASQMAKRLLATGSIAAASAVSAMPAAAQEDR